MVQAYFLTKLVSHLPTTMSRLVLIMRDEIGREAYVSGKVPAEPGRKRSGPPFGVTRNAHPFCRVAVRQNRQKSKEHRPPRAQAEVCATEAALVTLAERSKQRAIL